MKTERHKCSGSVWDRSGFHATKCGNNAKLHEEGRWWCGVHAPSARAKRDAKRVAVWDARTSARDRRNAISAARDRVFDAVMEAFDHGGITNTLSDLYDACAEFKNVIGGKR